MEEFLDKLPQMDLMRSEKMTLVQLIIPIESARRSITYLGEVGLLQFRDLNADKSPFQRTFANQAQYKICRNMVIVGGYLREEARRASSHSQLHHWSVAGG